MKYIFLSLIILLNMASIQGQSLTSKDSITILSVIEDWNKGWQTRNHELASRGAIRKMPGLPTHLVINETAEKKFMNF